MSNSSSTATLDDTKCSLCNAEFTFLFRRHRCRPCGAPVCSNCSQHRWHRDCVPNSKNTRSESIVRVCDDCYRETNKLHTLMKAGDVREVSDHFRQKRADRFFLDHRSPFSEENERPLHIAARSGSVPLLRWLLEVNSCELEPETRNGATPLAIAAKEGKFEAVCYLYSKGAQLSKIRNLSVALTVLETALGRLNGCTSSGTGSTRRFSSAVSEDTSRKVTDNGGLTEDEALLAAIQASSKMEENRKQEKTTMKRRSSGSRSRRSVISSNAGFDEESALEKALRESKKEAETVRQRTVGGIPLTTSAAMEAMVTAGSSSSNSIEALPTAPIISAVVAVAPPPPRSGDLPPSYSETFS